MNKPLLSLPLTLLLLAACKPCDDPTDPEPLDIAMTGAIPADSASAPTP